MLWGQDGERPLRAVVYLDDIAVFIENQEQVMADTLETVRRLSCAGFMINVRKSQLAYDQDKVLGHQWSSRGFWAPMTLKLERLSTATTAKVAAMSRAGLYGLLNFYHEYAPVFDKVTEPI